MTSLGQLEGMNITQLEPLELSAGIVYGQRRGPAGAIEEQWPIAGPRETLEEILLTALTKPPCVVAFSGGRDSSAILAEATRVARSHGLDDPVPHTLIFGDAPRTAEDEWQELVIRHLGLQERTRQRVGDELDALGPIATEVIRRHGVHWPPNIHTFKLMMDPAAGGSLLTGNGGDEAFTWGGHRLGLIRRGKAIPRRDDIRPLLRYLIPNSLLIRRAIRDGRFRLPWLSPDAAVEIQRIVLSESLEFERTFAQSLENYLHSRYFEVVSGGVPRGMAQEAGVALVEPFLDVRYLRSVAADPPPEGYRNRMDAMRRLFGDLLPAKVSSRQTKAVFTEVFVGAETRAFAEQWTGAGVDPALVEPEALRKAWLAPRVDIRSLVPIQAAWLAAN